MEMSKFSNFKDIGKKIVAFARTYRDHAVELNNPIPTEPFVFLKPTSSYIVQGQNIVLPKNANEIHYEVELGVIIGKDGSNIQEAQADNHIAGYTLALDMTDRGEQAKAKKGGLPWTLAKGFDTACPISRFISKEEIKNPQDANLLLKVNGEVKQKGNTKDMIFSIAHLISWISEKIKLEEGDLILTGTPAGVGPVKAGDVIDCSINENLVEMSFEVVSKN